MNRRVAGANAVGFMVGTAMLVSALIPSTKTMNSIAHRFEPSRPIIANKAAMIVRTAPPVSSGPVLG